MARHGKNRPSGTVHSGAGARHPVAVVASLATLALLLAACSGGASAPATTSAPAALAQPATSAPAGATPTTAAPMSAASLTAASAASPATPAPTAGVAAAGATPAATPGATQGAPAIKGSLTVFAAASLTDAFKEMKTTIEAANAGTTVTYNFAGSPTLRTQLGQGAPADVFASADQPNMQGAQQDGSISGQPRVFAQNKLTLIVPIANPAGVSTLQDLAKPGLKLVLAQKDVPVGNYARQVLAKLSVDPAQGPDFATKALANLKSEEANVKDVVSKVQLGEADAGIVYLTDVTPSVRGAVRMIDIPDQFNVIAQYPVAAVKNARNEAGAQAFIDFVLSPTGQAVLAKYGFAPGPAQAAAAGQSGAAAPGGGGVALGGQVERPASPVTTYAWQMLRRREATAPWLNA